MKLIASFASLICCLLIGILLLIFFTPIANLLARPLVITPTLQKADAILVLSGGVYPNGSLTYFSLERLVQAAIIYKKGLAPKIILSGGISTVNNKTSDAWAIKKTALKLGINDQDIILEDKSKNTVENLKYSQNIIKEKKFSKVLLVTSAIHSYRSMLIAKNLGLKLIPASPEPFEQYRIMSIDRFLLFYFTIREYAALLYYRLYGFGD